MLRRFARLLLLCIVIAGGTYALVRYENTHSDQAQQQEKIRKLEEQKQQLQQFVARLTQERRVAEVLVTDQVVNGDKVQSTTLMFVEYARDGSRLPPKFFTIKGKTAHIDSLVIRFQDKFIELGDGLRGQSLLMFYRVYDEFTPPSEGHRIDEPGRAPEFYRPDPGISREAHAFEAELWRDFWKLMDDPALRAARGVKLVQGEGLWRHFYPDEVYTVTHTPAGGLSISARPIDGLWKEYRDALRKQRSS